MSGVVSPLVYYLGIEDNKKKVKEYMLASVQKVNKKKTTTNEEQNNENLPYKKTPVEEIDLSHINHNNLTD